MNSVGGRKRGFFGKCFQNQTLNGPKERNWNFPGHRQCRSRDRNETKMAPIEGNTWDYRSCCKESLDDLRLLGSTFLDAIFVEKFIPVTYFHSTVGDCATNTNSLTNCRSLDSPRMPSPTTGRARQCRIDK